MDTNFDRPVFPKFEAPWVKDLPYMLETCRGGPRPIRLCVEKTKNFGQIQRWADKKFFIFVFFRSSIINFTPKIFPSKNVFNLIKLAIVFS